MKLSIVATLYQSAPYIREFCQRSAQAARELVGEDYEIVLVNDGSPDRSLEVALEVAGNDDHIVVVDLSRNFGHHKAMMTGLSFAQGDQVFLLDSDLEEEPEWIFRFNEIMAEQQSDVVYGVQTRRKGGWLERWTGHWYYSIFKTITGISLPESVVTARLMTKRFVQSLLRHDEREMFLGGLFALTGYSQISCVVKKHCTSETTYDLRRKLRLLVDSITSFSNSPLVFIFNVGIAIFGMSILYCTYLLVIWLFFAKPPSGWPSVMASIWLLGGLVISFLGVIGIYLSKIFMEAKRRPYSIVREIYGRNR